MRNAIKYYLPFHITDDGDDVISSFFHLFNEFKFYIGKIFFVLFL